MKKRLSLFFLLFFPLCIVAQRAGWTINPFGERWFIENKGQFNGLDDNRGSQTLYGVQHSGEQFYFSNNGFTYRLDIEMHTGVNGEPAAEYIRHESEENKSAPTYSSQFMQFSWINSNPNCRVIATDPEAADHTYHIDGKAFYHVKGYNKLIYRDLYKGIDAEYTIHPEKGIKYNLIVHPGADLNQVRFRYSGNMSLDPAGDLTIQSGQLMLTDQAPVCFYSSDNKKIACSYVLGNKEVGFHVASYDKTRSLVIDPWVTNPAFTGQNKAFDIAKDAAGNVYVFGGGPPWQLKKFTPAGVLSWTYNTGMNSWYGDLAVDLQGNSYITNGCCAGTVAKVSTNNTVTWTQSYGTFEMWCLSFNCDYTKLYLGNGYSANANVTPFNSIANINLTTGAITGGVALNSGGGEPRAMSWGPSGNLYFLSCTGGNRTFAVTPAFANIFSIGSGYTLGYNGPTYANGSNTTSGQNGIYAGKSFYVTSDGRTLMKRHLITGALLAQVVIPGGVVEGNSGVLIDDCNNVYAGSSNAIYKYDSSLVQLTSVATTGAVYCLSEGMNGEVLASGNGFIGSYNLNYSQFFLTMTASSTNAGCGCSGTATASASGGCTSYSYSWSNGSTQQSISNLCAGTYTVSAISWCQFRTATVQITSTGGLTLNTSAVNGNCSTAGSASVTSTGGANPYTYSWNNGQTTQTATGLGAGTFTVTVTDAGGCSSTKTVAVTQTGGITSASVAPFTNILCNGGNNGTATASVTGGTGTLTYSWSNSQTSQTATGLTAGTYTLTVTDSNGCTRTTTVTISQPPVLNTNTSSAGTACGQTNGTASVTASGGNGAFTYSWNGGQTGQTATGLSAGSYTVLVTDNNGCTKTASVNVTGTSGPTVTISGSVNANCATTGTATASSSGGTGTYTYSWSIGGQTTQTASGLTAGTYTVMVTDNSGCTQTTTVSITGSPGPTASISNSVNATCASSGNATASAVNGNGTYTYSWNNGQTAQNATGLAAGSYTVTVTDGNGCTSTATVTITGGAGPSVSSTSPTNVLCNGGTTGAASATATGGTGALTYVWSNGQTAQNATGLTAGTYTVVVSDNNGCTSTATVVITEPPVLTVSASGTVSCAGQAATASATGGGGSGAYNYLWNNGQATQTATGLTNGMYTVTITDANSCTATATAQVNANSSPSAVFTGVDTAGCVPLCVTFNNATANITSWSWSFGDGSTGIGASPKHCYTSPGTYSVTLTVTDNNGCTGTYTKTNWIQVYPQVTAAFTASPQPTTVLNPIIQFTDLSSNATAWNWSFGDILNSTSTLQNPKFDYKDSGCYNVQLIANNTYNCPDTADERICIQGQYELYAPNAFTPDGDGLNDRWNVKGIGIDPSCFEMYIFDRWGNLIFKTSDLYEGWDGRANGGKNIAQMDVYVWRVFTCDFLGKNHSYIGHVSLVR